MAYPERLLEPGERVVLDLHPHWKRLIGPFLIVPVVIGLAVFLAVLVPDGSLQSPVRWALLLAAVVVLVLWSLAPYLRWLTTNYVITSRRVVLRHGVLAREGRDIPLGRINDVTFTHTVWERFLRAGTLTIESAGEHGQVVLADVPDVEAVQHTVYRLTEEEDHRRRGMPSS